MDKDKQNHEACIHNFQNDHGRANLCCCYVIDRNGNLKDPCHTPVDDCLDRIADNTSSAGQ